MGDIADGIINGDFDEQTGEYIGPGQGFPRTMQPQRKSQDLSWRKVTSLLYSEGFKQHLHPQILKGYGCTYTGKKALRNACFEVLKDYDKFKEYIKQLKLNEQS